MNTATKYTIVILIDDQERTYTAAASALTPWEAVGVAWHRIAQEMGFPTKPPQKNGQATPPVQHPEETMSQKASAVQHPEEADETVCPDHQIAKESNFGGLFCPFYNEAEAEYCKWTFGRKSKKGAR